jgi:hypothetical protein
VTTRARAHRWWDVKAWCDTFEWSGQTEQDSPPSASGDKARQRGTPSLLWPADDQAWRERHTPTARLGRWIERVRAAPRQPSDGSHDLDLAQRTTQREPGRAQLGPSNARPRHNATPPKRTSRPAAIGPPRLEPDACDTRAWWPCPRANDQPVIHTLLSKATTAIDHDWGSLVPLA